MPRVSIIVPAYNAARYLPAAIESVISQSEQDWELILVDDGSTDRTAVIIDEAAARDNRIRAFHKQNGGTSEAKNYGIERAEGDWITILDADDLLHPQFLKQLLALADSTGVEIVACGHCSIEVTHTAEFLSYHPAEAEKYSIHTTVQATQSALYQRNFIASSPWGKLYARRIWEKMRFRKGVWYEDLDIFYALWLSTDKIAYMPAPLYGYRQHQGSFLHSFRLDRADVLDVTDRMVEWIGANHPQLLAAARDRRLSAHFDILTLLYAHSRRNAAATSEEFRRRCRDIESRCLRVIRQERMASLLNPRVRIKNKVGIIISLLGGAPLLRVATRISGKT